MKPIKVAAAVAGSVMALGIAAPAMAAESALPAGLGGGLGSLTGSGLSTDALSNTKEGSPVKTVTDTASKLNQAGKGATSLLGGLPIGGALGG
ncbi:hypothetical protein ABZ990_06670 [Streptomyces sp. NPDC046203]|uniref:hypothetical protein n=1 Tax=Streptomyces sp. NPDC046203 TaxID=3154602 RepID=UPI0033E961D5